jgi:N-acetylmuramoyl-L-alanine amidase
VAVRDAATGAGITSATVSVADSALVSGSPSSTYGFVGSNTATVISAPGYQPVAIADTDTVHLAPWFGGVLLGKRFVLDAQGGTPRTAGVGAMGLASSHVNLRVANYLAGFLRNAGAVVRLARTTEEVPLSEDVARMTNKFRADRYIEIRHPGAATDSARSVRSYYFPGSAKGRVMASVIGGAAARRLSAEHHGPDETVTFPLQQTACPAVVVALPSIALREEEMRLAQAWYLREQAYALFIGILAMAEAPAGGTLTVDVIGADRRDWMVTLDGTWSLSSDENGRVVFDYVPPGPHRLLVRRADVSLTRDVVTTAAAPSASLSVEPTPAASPGH